MSSPAGIAGIVVSVVIGTPLVATVIFFTSYFVYKYIRKHPSLLSNLSQGRKPPARNRIKDEPSILPTKKPSPGLDFDNAAFLNAMSNTSRELDPDQQSQSPTQHTILSYLSRDYTADDTLRTQVSGLVEQETRHNDQVKYQIIDFYAREFWLDEILVMTTCVHQSMHITAFQSVPRWLLTGFTEIDSFCLQAVRSKPILIRPEHEVGQHVLRATRRLSTHVPIYEADDLEYDFSNPAFERSDKFMQYQTAAVLLQSCWRGYLLRRQLPQIRLEKLNKDRLSMLGGMKQTASLANLRFFDVRGYGYIEVEQLYGLEVVRSAVKKLKKKYGNKGRVKMKIIVTPKGVKLFDTATNGHVATVKIEGISFCSLDPNNRKIFAFINRKKGRNFCHVFQCNEEDSQELVEVCAEAFDRVVRHYEASGTADKRPVSKKSELLDEDTAST